MILADTSIWIDHLRTGNRDLTLSLERGKVLMHTFVVGELACGNLRDRHEILSLLRELPAAMVATDEEVLAFIERRALMGRGIGYIDAHLLAAAVLTGARLWTGDKRLARVASELEVAITPS